MIDDPMHIEEDRGRLVQWRDVWQGRWRRWTSLSPALWPRHVKWGSIVGAALLAGMLAAGIWYVVRLPARLALLRSLQTQSQLLSQARLRSAALPELAARHAAAEAEGVAWLRRIPEAPMGDGAASDRIGGTAGRGAGGGGGGGGGGAHSGDASANAKSDVDVEAEAEAATSSAPQWRADVERLAARAGVALLASRPGRDEWRRNLLVERAELDVEGGGANLLAFLGAVQAAPRQVDVERLVVTGASDGTRSGVGGVGRSPSLGAKLTLIAYRWQATVSGDANSPPEDIDDAASDRDGLGPVTLPAWPASFDAAWTAPTDLPDAFSAPLGRGQVAVAVSTGEGPRLTGESTIVGHLRFGARIVRLRFDEAEGLIESWETTAREKTTTRNGEPRPERAMSPAPSSMPQAMSPTDPAVGAAASSVPDGDTVDISLRGVAVSRAIRLLAKLLGRNVVISEQVGGRVDLDVSRLAPSSAFDVLVRTAGLDMRSVGNTTWVAPRAVLLADEQVQLEASARREKLQPLASRRFTLNYPRVEALRKHLMGEAGQRLLSPRGNLIADPRTNQLFVSDLPDKLDEIGAFIARIDVPVRQVLIEARIVEADDSFGEALGVKLAGRTGALGLGNMPEAGGADFDRANDAGGGESAGESGIRGGKSRRARATRSSGDGDGAPRHAVAVALPAAAAALGGLVPSSLAITLFGRSATEFLQAELSALETNGRGRIVSRPRVVTADKVQATIEQGTQLPYFSRTGRRGNSAQLQFRDASLKLEVTPLIAPDGQVILDVDVRKDSIGREVLDGLAIDRRHVKTQVRVEDGGTVAIGGIFQEEQRDADAEVPWLGKIPVLGALFRNRSSTQRRTELLVFLTPSVVPEADGVSLLPALGPSPEHAELPLPRLHPRLTGDDLWSGGAASTAFGAGARPRRRKRKDRQNRPGSGPKAGDSAGKRPTAGLSGSRRVPHARRISRYHRGLEPKSQRFMLENVILVGLMGAGKTTVGRAIARRLGRQFYDSDHEIEARTGVRIPIIFEHEGEDGFRLREAQAIDDLTQRSGIVLATGGGAVLRAENRERIRSRGMVVYLRANPHDLWLRTRRDKNRPLLQTADPRARLEQLFQERDALYRECATFIIETGRPSVNALVNMVLMQLEMAGVNVGDDPDEPADGSVDGVEGSADHAGEGSAAAPVNADAASSQASDVAHDRQPVPSGQAPQGMANEPAAQGGQDTQAEPPSLGASQTVATAPTAASN